MWYNITSEQYLLPILINSKSDGFGEPFDGGLMQHSLLADGVADTLNGQYAVMDSGGSYSESPDGSPDNGTPPGAGLAG